MQADQRRLVLASASPRRRELLEAACYLVDVRPPQADEAWPGGSPEDAAVQLAVRKFDLVGENEALALAADTVVWIDDQALGKPRDAAEAARMLERLAGREHRVVTGFCAGFRGKRQLGAVQTRVWMRAVSAAEVERYVRSGEPMDKAGAYAIQGGGGALVERVEGSYTNIVGLPLAEVLEALERVQ